MNRIGAVLLLALLALGACSPEASPDPAATDSPDSPAPTLESPQAEPTQPKAVLSPGVPIELGQGLIQGTTLDGSSIYVSENVEGSEGMGCEGQGRSVVKRVPIGGGPRTPVAEAGSPVQGAFVRGGSDGRVAVFNSCEEFVSSAYVAKESRDGRITEAEKVPIPTESLPRFFGWSNDGLYLLGVVATPDGAQSRVVQVDPGSGALTDLFRSDPVSKVAQLKDGSYVVASNNKIAVRSTTKVLRSFDGSTFEVTTAGDRFVIMGGGLSLVSGDSEPKVLLKAEPESQIPEASFSPTGELVTYERIGSVGDKVKSEIGVVSAAGAVQKVEASGPKGRRTLVAPVFTGDGKVVAYNRFVEDFEAPPTVVVFRLPE